jgi:acetyl esterase/lipase
MTHKPGLLFLLAAITLLAAFNRSLAQEPEELLLWSEGAPHAGGQEPADQPRLHVYRLGITAAVCIYRHRGGGNAGAGYGHPVPMLDAQRAIRTVRAATERWNVDPARVGVIGFSAGGHLASTVSTHFDAGNPQAADPIERVSSRPDFAILGYPVIALDQPHTHRGSQRNLLGENPDPELLKSLSNEQAVTDQTPPTFLFHTAEDQAVPAENSLQYFSALLRSGVPGELHVFEKGRHGIGLAADHGAASAWPRLCARWLQTQGVIKP